jgi:F-type H+-transporting ATPase subunit epsilon
MTSQAAQPAADEQLGIPQGTFRRRFQVEVLTPEGRLCSVEAESARFPASDGLVGVLGGRGPMVALVGAGPLTIGLPDGAAKEYYAAGGFAHMLDNVLVFLAEECTALSDLDREEVWEEITRARALPAETDEEVRRRDERVTVARIKFSLVQAYHRRGKGPRSGVDLDED